MAKRSETNREDAKVAKVDRKPYVFANFASSRLVGF
jgi:hypothetical protein